MSETKEETNVDPSIKKDQEVDKNVDKEEELDGFWGGTWDSVKKYAPKIIKKLLG